MSGPYFPGQIASPCGCYYPDITRVQDDRKKRIRICFCICHGWQEYPLSPGTIIGNDVQGIPTEEWRETQRNLLRNRYPQKKE